MIGDFAEDLNKRDFENPIDYVNATCKEKYNQLLETIKEKQIEFDLLIVCDTIMEFEGEIFEKPVLYIHSIRLEKRNAMI